MYDLPDLAWTNPACVFRGHLSKSQLTAKKSGQMMTNKLAAPQGTRHSELQVDTGTESLTALSPVVSVGHSASLGAQVGGASLGASMVHPLLPSPSAASDLAYDESLKENEEAEAKTNLPQLSPVPSLTLTSLQLQSVDGCLSLILSSLSQMLSALLVSLIQYTNLRFQFQSLQQKELAKSAADSLQQEELDRTALTAEDELTADRACGSLCFSPTRARQSFQLTQAQLCRPQSSVESFHQNELAAAYATDLSFQLQSLNSRKSLRQLTSSRLNPTMARRGPVSFKLCRSQLLAQEFCRHKVLQQELFRNQLQAQQVQD